MKEYALNVKGLSFLFTSQLEQEGVFYTNKRFLLYSQT